MTFYKKTIVLLMLVASISFHINLDKGSAETLRLELGRDVNVIDLVYDEGTDFVYAVTSNKKLLYINTTDLKVEHELSLSSIPNAIKLYKGNIYVALKNEQKVVVTSTTFDGNFKEINLNSKPFRIELGNNRLFYVDESNHQTVWSYDLESGQSNAIGDFYEPELLFDHSKNTLYISESRLNDNVKLYLVEFEGGAATSKLLADLTSNYLVRHPMTLIGDYLYLGRYEIDVRQGYQVIRDDITEQIIASSENYVMTNAHEIFQIYEPYSNGKLEENMGPIGKVEFLNNDRLLVYIEYASRFIIFKSVSGFLDLNIDYYLENFISENDFSSKYYPPDIVNHWAAENLDDFVSADLLKGIEDQSGNVRAYPDKTITRAEFTALLVRALDLKQPVGTPKQFKDVKPGDWYYNVVQIGSSYGFVGGFSDGRFLPNEEVKRDQMASMIVRAFASKIKFGGGIPKTFKDVPNYWAKKAITDASALGIVAGKTPTEFKLNLSATRAEAVVMLYRALHKETVNMPTNQEIENVVLTFRNQLKQALAEKNLQAAQLVIDQYTTGFYNETTQIDFNFYQYVLNKGIDITTTHNGKLDVNHIDISPRFAVVELAGAQYESTYDKNSVQISEPYDLSGTYFLRKLPDGSWKIYNLYLNEAVAQGSL